MKRKTSINQCFWGFVFILVFSFTMVASGGEEFTFIKIADNTTPVPDSMETFYYYGFSAIDRGSVAFYGMGSGGKRGIYLYYDNQFFVAADYNTPIPDGTGNFTTLRNPSIDGNSIAFYGMGANGQKGIYCYVDGIVKKVADFNTPQPGGVGNFTYFGDFPSADGGKIAFLGGGDSGYGIYVYDESTGVYSTIADSNTIVPGTANTFVLFHGVFMAGGHAAFRGESSANSNRRGTYLSTGDVLTAVADSSIPIPGDPEGDVFSGTNSPSLDRDGSVVFQAVQPGGLQCGVYLHMGGVLRLVADTFTLMPDSTDYFKAFSHILSIDNGDVIFEGVIEKPSFFGVFFYNEKEDTISKVIANGGLLDGKVISSYRISRECYSENTIVIRVVFDDGTQALYIAFRENLEGRCRRLSKSIRALDPGLFKGPNKKVKRQRRKILAKRAVSAAEFIKKNKIQRAVNKLNKLLRKIDGTPPDWMHDSPEKTILTEEVTQLIFLLQQLLI